MDDIQVENIRQRNTTNRLVIKTLREIETEFTKKGENFNKTYLKNIDKDPPKTPSFPFIIVGMAILKDVVDVTDLTIIGPIWTTFFTIICSSIMFLWCLGKIKGGMWKKPIIRWMLQGLAYAYFIEIIPYIKIFPANTIFILMAHFKHKKIVQLFEFALEKIHKANIMDRVSVG